MRNDSVHQVRAVARALEFSGGGRMRDAKSGGASDARAVQAVSGTFAVCLLLAGTKWASYLGSAPLFLTDTLLALAVFHHLVSQ